MVSFFKVNIRLHLHCFLYYSIFLCFECLQDMHNIRVDERCAVSHMVVHNYMNVHVYHDLRVR